MTTREFDRRGAQAAGNRRVLWEEIAIRERLRAWNSAATLAAVGVLAALFGGTWWVAQAIYEGAALVAVMRIAISGLVGAYYVLLLQATTLSRRVRRL